MPVTYQEASWTNGKVTYADKSANCTPVESSTAAVTWNATWYAASGSVTVDQPITVEGAVNLILADGCTLTAEQGIVVTDSNSLTIYAQSGGTGGSGAKAGGASNIQNIQIHSGTAHATGGYLGTGIGGGGFKFEFSGTVMSNVTGGTGGVILNENYAVSAGYSLHIPAGASLSGRGTLTGGGTFTADLSEDMV